MYVHIYDLLTIATRYPSFLHLGNQFVSCGMDWSICHFDAFSHTKNFIHNFLRVPEKEAKSRFQGVFFAKRPAVCEVRALGKLQFLAAIKAHQPRDNFISPRCHKQMPPALGRRTPKPGVSRVPSAAHTPGSPANTEVGAAADALRGPPGPQLPALPDPPSAATPIPGSAPRAARNGCLPLPHSPAPQEDMVCPGHGEGDELLELPTTAPALRVGRGFPGRRGDQVSGIAEEELPAVAPVFVRFSLAAQRLRPGGYSRVLAQVLGHVLRHVGPAGRGERERTEPRAAERRGAALSARPAPANLPRTPLRTARTPNNRARRRRTAHFRRPPARSLLSPRRRRALARPSGASPFSRGALRRRRAARHSEAGRARPRRG